MPNLEDYLYDMGISKDQQKKPMWGEVIPEPGSLDEKDKGSGILGIVGKLAKLGGTVANMIPGGQVAGIPLSIAGGAMEGGEKGGIAGAATGGAMQGAMLAAPAGMGKAFDYFKSPVDTGAFTGFGSTGKPLTVPGVREAPVEVFSSSGSPMTVPASPKTFGGS